MGLPTARHAELGPAPVAGLEGVEQRLDLATQVGFHPHAAPFQGQPQRLGNGGAEQHVHPKFRHAAGQPIRW